MNGWQSLGFKSYNEYLQSDLWKEKRELILSIFNWECQKCGSKKRLEIHHKTYENVGNEKQRDVTVLCKKCHEEKYNG